MVFYIMGAPSVNLRLGGGGRSEGCAGQPAELRDVRDQGEAGGRAGEAPCGDRRPAAADRGAGPEVRRARAPDSCNGTASGTS